MRMARVRNGYGGMSSFSVGFVMTLQLIFLVVFFSYNLNNYDNITFVQNNLEELGELKTENAIIKQQYKSLVETKEVICTYEEKSPNALMYLYCFIFGVLATLISMYWLGPIVVEKYMNKKKREDDLEKDKKSESKK